MAPLDESRSPFAQGAASLAIAAFRYAHSRAGQAFQAASSRSGLKLRIFLLDTNIISELRRSRPHGAVVAWLDRAADTDLHLSAITIGELQAGIEITREQDPAKANEIERWLELVCETYNVIPMDAAIFRQWARLMHRRSNDLLEDAMVAATAIARGLTVVTRNTRDFDLLGVKTLNPLL